MATCYHLIVEVHSCIKMRLLNIIFVTILILVLDGLAVQVMARSWLKGSRQSVSLSLKFRLQQADVMAEMTSINDKRDTLGKLLSIRGGSSPMLSQIVNFLYKLLESIFGFRTKERKDSHRKLKPAANLNKRNPKKVDERNESSKKKAIDGGVKGHLSNTAVSSSSGTNRLRKV